GDLPRLARSPPRTLNRGIESVRLRSTLAEWMEQSAVVAPASASPMGWGTETRCNGGAHAHVVVERGGRQGRAPGAVADQPRRAGDLHGPAQHDRRLRRPAPGTGHD